MVNHFDKQLSVVLEGAQMRPALVVTARGVEIRADHARFMKTSKGNVFLAVGIKPQIKERYVGFYVYGGPIRKARDFYAPDIVNDLNDSHTYNQRLVQQRFAKILTIRKENIRSLKWL